MASSDSDDAPLMPKVAAVKTENPPKKIKSEVKSEHRDDKPIIAKVKPEKGAKPATIKSEDSDEEPLVKSGKASPKAAAIKKPAASSKKAAAVKKPAASSKSKSKAAAAKVKGGVKKDKGKSSKAKSKTSAKGASKGMSIAL